MQQLPNDTRWNSQLDTIKTYLSNHSLYIDIRGEHMNSIDTLIGRLINNLSIQREAINLQEQLEIVVDKLLISLPIKVSIEFICYPLISVYREWFDSMSLWCLIENSSEVSLGSIPGLINVGNTCYVNCILQALSSCPSFIRWLGFKGINSSQILLRELNKMVQILNDKADDDVACAYGITEALRFHGWVISSEEQDAHELFHAIFSTVDDEINTLKEQSNSLFNLSWIQDIKEREKMEKEGFENLSVACADSLSSVEENSSYMLQENTENFENTIEGLSIISKVSRNSNINYNAQSLSGSRSLESPFKGYLASQLICKICGFKVIACLEVLNNGILLSLCPYLFQVALRNFQNISLTDLLENYVRPELVTDVTCEGCTKLKGRNWMSTFSKQLTIGKIYLFLQLPECLCFHIPRTHWLDNGSAVKRKDFVNIPEILDMAPYTYISSSKILQNKGRGLLGGQTVLKRIPENVQSNEAILNPLPINYNERFKRKTLYKLQAVIVHVGDAVSGHFVTYRRGSINTSLRNRWYYTSDMVVKEVSANEVLQSNMYMAIYEKCSY
ncbi:Ubiquitin carboxyl-terminal hydrolase 30 [Armadillidium vulgare]|nr:Ubiquitin carboxyl-terminal hydrolase 30 [Armadillidium vulgare]